MCHEKHSIMKKVNSPTSVSSQIEAPIQTKALYMASLNLLKPYLERRINGNLKTSSRLRAKQRNGDQTSCCVEKYSLLLSECDIY